MQWFANGVESCHRLDLRIPRSIRPNRKMAVYRVYRKSLPKTMMPTNTSATDLASLGLGMRFAGFASLRTKVFPLTPPFLSCQFCGICSECHGRHPVNTKTQRLALDPELCWESVWQQGLEVSCLELTGLSVTSFALRSPICSFYC